MTTSTAISPMNPQDLTPGVKYLDATPFVRPFPVRFRLAFVAVLGISMLAGLGVPTGQGQTQLVTYFNFNDSATNVPNVVSDAPGLQTSTITTNFLTPGTNFVTETGTPVNKFPSDMSAETFALRLRAGAGTTTGGTGGNNGMNIQFSVNTTGLTDLALSYATRRTATGFTLQTVAYSVNGGAFTDIGTFTPPTSTTFSTASFNLSAISELENQAMVTFRITFTGATDSAGANGIDNIQLTAVPEPGTVAAGFLGLIGLSWHQRRRLGSLLRSHTSQSSKNL